MGFDEMALMVMRPGERAGLCQLMFMRAVRPSSRA
jgi:hypothetical protein